MPREPKKIPIRKNLQVKGVHMRPMVRGSFFKVKKILFENENEKNIYLEKIFMQ